MGRVYDALKRASDTESNGARADSKQSKTSTSSRRNGSEALSEGEPTAAHPWDRSPLFAANGRSLPIGAAHTSAPTAHTEEHVGKALSDAHDSRAAGATLGAAGATRAAVEFVSVDISQARVEPHLVAITQPRSSYCEHFRSLRTRVLQAGERRKMQAFVITSSGVAEGKTLTALNLAWLLAQTDGVRALLIDSDLRQPCATDYFGIDARTGLSEVLAGEATLNESIIRLEPAGLHLLPGGAARDDVAELLSGPKFGAVLAQLRPLFDYIIIDAPPLGIFTDANVLINRADGALLVVRAGHTRYSAVERLLEQLPRDRVLGVVLNRAQEESSESDYYYQRRYQRRPDGSPSGTTPPPDAASTNGTRIKDEEATVIS
ncbi:MAG: CpsD/CapB family tyrosine-protein kinase [Pyrinomonadaceae bacterium]